LEEIADQAKVSENYLQTVEAIAKLARYIARREGHRHITVSDIQAAIDEVMPRLDLSAREAVPDTPQQPGTRRTPVRAAERVIKGPLKAPARSVRPIRIQPVETGSKAPFSSRSGDIESVETDLVPVEA